MDGETLSPGNKGTDCATLFQEDKEADGVTLFREG